MNEVGRSIREHILRCSYASGHGHMPTSFSVVELILATYSIMKHDPKNPKWEERDVFILSKGHAALGYYCVLAHLNYFSKKEVERFGAFNSLFGCHPDRLKVPGVEVSCGSLGHGINVGVGIALAFQIKKSPRRVFALIGDGESNEGTVWESLMVASHLKLDNLTILFDNNRSQERCLPIHDPVAKFRAFGCTPIEVNGHDLEEVKAALKQAVKGPKVIVGNTVKGYGCPTLVENVYEWHRKSPEEPSLKLLINELYEKTV